MVDFFDVAQDAARGIIERAKRAMGAVFPIDAEQTPVYESAKVLAEYSAAVELELGAGPSESSVRSAIAELAPWRDHVAEVEMLANAAECRLELEHGRPVTMVQLQALTGWLGAFEAALKTGDASRIAATLAKLLHHAGPGSRGLVSICAAGGQGVAALLEGI